jgi:hypothetical protein
LRPISIAACLHEGVMDSFVLPWVNAEMMSMFLAEVAQRHAKEFVVMVMDRAGGHLVLQPENIET